jgi:septal ring factor EnvC (AmiA/AmiB activator)
VAELREQLEQAEATRAALQVENQDLHDELARLKNLRPQLPFKPSGTERRQTAKILQALYRLRVAKQDKATPALSLSARR